MKLGEIIYKKIECSWLKFYICVLFIVALIPFLTLFSESISLKDILAPTAILISVTILFIQMNYNMYINDLEMRNKKKEQTFKIMYDMYLVMNIDNFEEENESYVLNVFQDLSASSDEAIKNNKVFLLNNLNETPTLKIKLQKINNKLEFISSLYFNGQTDNKILISMLGAEFKSWSKSFLLIHVASGSKLDNFLKLCEKENIVTPDEVMYVKRMWEL
ncbi:MAG: hypothetical protein HRT42_07425 [Campylobacteraceae bacterium]|nr:hypothetical protein [Campylobacteraceae bacterium]